MSKHKQDDRVPLGSNAQNRDSKAYAEYRAQKAIGFWSRDPTSVHFNLILIIAAGVAGLLMFAIGPCSRSNGNSRSDTPSLVDSPRVGRGDLRVSKPEVVPIRATDRFASQSRLDSIVSAHQAKYASAINDLGREQITDEMLTALGEAVRFNSSIQIEGEIKVIRSVGDSDGLVLIQRGSVTFVANFKRSSSTSDTVATRCRVGQRVNARIDITVETTASGSHRIKEHSYTIDGRMRNPEIDARLLDINPLDDESPTPKAKPTSPVRKVEPTPTTARLWCPDCAEAGMAVNLWSNWDRSNARKVGDLPHRTTVTVIEARRHAGEDRMYYRVSGKGITGWVPEDLIKVN